MLFRSNPQTIIEVQKKIAQLPLAGLPSLNHDSPEVMKYLLDSYKHFIDLGVKSFRLDAAKHISFSFLGQFCHELNQYAQLKHGTQLKFLVELLMHKSYPMDILAQELIRLAPIDLSLKLLDFPHASQLRSIVYTNYDFHRLVDFITIRSKQQTTLDRLIPFLENHDFETPLPDGYLRKLVYAISEFIHENSTILYHGFEGKGAIDATHRKLISEIDSSGEIGILLKKIRETIDSDMELEAQALTPDHLILSRNNSRKRVLLLANKSNRESLSFEIPSTMKITVTVGKVIKQNHLLILTPESLAIVK